MTGVAAVTALCRRWAPPVVAQSPTRVNVPSFGTSYRHALQSHLFLYPTGLRLASAFWTGILGTLLVRRRFRSREHLRRVVLKHGPIMTGSGIEPGRWKVEHLCGPESLDVLIRLKPPCIESCQHDWHSVRIPVGDIRYRPARPLSCGLGKGYRRDGLVAGNVGTPKAIKLTRERQAPKMRKAARHSRDRDEATRPQGWACTGIRNRSPDRPSIRPDSTNLVACMSWSHQRAPKPSGCRYPQSQ